MNSFPRSVCVTIFIAALLLRVLGLMVRHELTPPTEVGAEAGVIAQHLVVGQGFATPFDQSPPPSPVSPSTHLPPLYPLLLAAGMKLGLSPRGLFYAAILLNLLASAALPVIALAIGQAAAFPKPVTLLAAMALCFCPEAFRAVGLVWDEALFTAAAALMVLFMLCKLAPAREVPCPLMFTFILGLLNGALALLNPAMCIALPVAWLAALQAQGMRFGKLSAQALVLFVATFLGSSPWHVRNWFLLSPPAPVFIRGNFWLEIWSSLHPIERVKDPDGAIHFLAVHPWHGSESLLRTDTSPPTPLTEQQYFAWCRERVLAAFSENPRLLFQQIATQFNAFWFGIAEAQRWSRNAAIFFIAQGVPAILGILGLYAPAGASLHTLQRFFACC